MGHPSRIIVIGASAGGLEALKSLAHDLPADFPAAVLAVMHIPAHAPSLLSSILSRCGPLPVHEAIDGETIRAGHIYVGVPDRHLLVDGPVMRLSRGPRENRFRPAIDAMFRSAAYTHGERVVGVVLTGQLDDGTSGLWTVKERGGVAVVQAPRDALYPSMPMSALQHVQIDHVVNMATLPGLLEQLSRADSKAPATDVTAVNETTESPVAQQQALPNPEALANPSRFTCPECHGTLGEIREGTIIRFRCHTGHAFSQQTLLANSEDSADTALGNALRAFQEHTMLLQKAAAVARRRDEANEAELLEARARECEEKTRVIQELLQGTNGSQRMSSGSAVQLDLS